MDENKIILVADDDQHVRQSLSIYLKREGFGVLFAADGEEAVAQCLAHRPDLLVLDIMMPKKDGYAVCREVRRQMSIPIIMLTARDDEIDKLLGLELGSDDYVTKPFSPREVVARIKAVLRRVNAAPADSLQEEPDITIGNLTVSSRRRTVTLGGVDVGLTPKEFDILHMFCGNPGHVYGREHLLSTIWGYDFVGDTRAVDTHIKRIRSKLDNPQGWELRTVWGVGYCLDVHNAGNTGE